MCATFSSYSPSRLPRWRAAWWRISLRGLPNSFGCKTAEMEDSPPKSTICWLETEKAAGTQCFADRLRPSQAAWAGLLNDMHTLVLWCDYFFRCWGKTRGICLIPDLTLWKMLWVPVRTLVALCFLARWGGFVTQVINTLYAGVTPRFLHVQI